MFVGRSLGALPHTGSAAEWTASPGFSPAAITSACGNQAPTSGDPGDEQATQRKQRRLDGSGDTGCRGIAGVAPVDESFDGLAHVGILTAE